MIATSRTGIHLRLLAVTVACLAVLLAPAAAGTPQARAADGPSCATAAALVTRGLPRQALALATTGTPTCPDAAAAATEAITSSALAWVDADASLKAKKWAAAQASAKKALELDRENDDADKVRIQASLELERAKPRVTQPGAAVPADESKSWLEKLQDQWNKFFDHQLSPAGGLLLPFLGVLFGLVVLARLVVLAVPRWPAADDLPRRETLPKERDKANGHERAENPNGARSDPSTKDVIRRSIFASGMLSIGAASLAASLVTADSMTSPLSTTLLVGTLVATALAAWYGNSTASRQGVRAAKAAVPVPKGTKKKSPARLVKVGRQGSPQWHLRTHSAVRGLSIAAALLALAVLVSGFGDVDSRNPVQTLVVLGLATVLAVQGVWLLAWWLATRIRLDVKGPTGAAEVATVAAVLYELGAEKPRGLEVPRGADVTALDGALGSLPENPVLKVLKDIIRSISGVTPWTATIEGDATARVVTVVRNGRTLGSAILDPQRLGLDDKVSSSADDKAAATPKATAATPTAAGPVTADRTLQMAAAFVLATMAKEHPVIARGLAGTTSWKSVGYQYIGSTILVLPSDSAARDQKLALLGRALDEDGDNRAAQLAFRHAVDRDATDCQALYRYATFLADFYTGLDRHVDDFETTALGLRAVYTRAIVLVNAVYAHGDDGHQTDAGATCGLRRDDLVGQAQSALIRLRGLVEAEPGTSSADPLSDFKRQFEDDVQGTLMLARLRPDVPTPSSPIGMYNLGCAFASRHDVTWLPPATATLDEQKATELITNVETDDLTALTWLQLASQDPHTKEWMTDDPQLAKFRTRRTYRNTFLTKPRDDFFTLSTVTPFASQLKTAGYGDISLLAGAKPKTLSTFLPAAPGVCEQLVELARLLQGVSTYPPSAGVDRLNDLLRVFEEGPPSSGPGRLRWWVELVRNADEYLGDTSALPGQESGFLKGWAIEIVEDLSNRGLARRDRLIALPADRQVAVAKKIAATLMKKHQPGDLEETGDDLKRYEAQLSAAIAAWFRRPYELPPVKRG